MLPVKIWYNSFCHFIYFSFFFNFLFILLRKFFYNYVDMYFCSCFSVTHSCLTLCYPMDCNIPSILVHLLTEFAQTNVYQVGDAIQPSHPLLSLFFLPSIFPSSKVFSNELALHIRWTNYWSFCFTINPSNEYSGLVSFRIHWFDLFAVPGALKSLLQHHSSKASILLQHSAFLMVKLSHPYMTTGKKHSFDYTDMYFNHMISYYFFSILQTQCTLFSMWKYASKFWRL